MVPVRSQWLIVAALILCVVGAILLLFGNFAGWEERIAVDTRSSLYSYPDSGVKAMDSAPGLIGIGLPAVLLLAAAVYLGRSLWASGITENRRRQWQRNAVWCALGAAGMAFASGAVFLATMDVLSPSDWWLDWGFYGGVIGGGLAALLVVIAGQVARRESAPLD